ncbi:MAG TPA: hypothetical protein VH352_27230 [Pseudonocardiaceae bacterium]|jgi:hypothetical protein|nr:hypothetical protein [Pseudonocardiaceae bacterium]
MTTSDWIATAAIVISLVVPSLAVWYTRRQAVANKQVAVIEADRRHEELTPQLDITCTEQYGDRAELNVAFTGPLGLGRLDEIIVEILDDRPDRQPSPTHLAEITIEKFRQFIWGPYRFARGVDGSDAAGRTVPPFALDRGDSRPLVVDRSMHPYWYTNPENWRLEQEGKPVRLRITCRANGHEKQWVIPCRVVQVDKAK